jgi:hypothetical protein
MKMVDQYEFILAIESKFYLLLLTLGLIFLVPSIIEIKGLKLLDEKYRKFALLFGSGLLVLGCLTGFFPDDFNIDGKIIIENGTIPPDGAIITINGESKAVAENGSYQFFDIPRNTDVIRYQFHGVTHKKVIRTNPLSVILGFHDNFDFSFPIIHLEGNIFKSSGNVPPKIILVTTLGVVEKGPFKAISDNYGYYNLSVPSENPVKIDIIDTSSGQTIRTKIVEFNESDIDRRFKQVDINIDDTINIAGIILRYREGLDQKPIPVIGAMIDVGDRQDVTNSSGFFLLRAVPRDVKKYNLTLLNGTRINGTVVPPLSDESEDMIKTNRYIYIC